jgi:hypothetical protein
MSRFPYTQYPQPPNDSEISPIKNAIPAHIPGIPDDQLVSFNDLKVGYYYYFSFLEHTGDEDDDAVGWGNPIFVPSIYSGRFVKKRNARLPPGTKVAFWDNLKMYRWIEPPDEGIGEEVRIPYADFNTLSTTTTGYSPMVEMNRKVDLRRQARDLASGEVAGILRHRDKTRGLVEEGTALDRAMASGILPSQVGKFLTDDKNIHKGSFGEVKQSLRNISEKLKNEGGRHRKTKRRARKTRRRV